MSQFADTSKTDLAFGVQTNEVTQQTALNKLRNTGSSLQFTAESVQSQEIRADRNVTDIIRTQSSVSGNIDFELSYATFDAFLEGVLSATKTGTGTAIDPFTIVNGTQKKYFTLERSFETGVTDQFEQYLSCEVDTMSLSIAASEIITGSMGLIGLSASQSTSSVDVDGYAPANTNRVFNSVNMVNSVLEGGVEYKSTIQSLSLDIANNKRESRAIGSEAPSVIGDGQFVVTGQITVYFKDNVLYDKFLNETVTSLSVELEDDAGNMMIFTMPKVIYTNVAREIPGNNEDVLVVLDYQAIYDSGISGSIMIEMINA